MEKLYLDFLDADSLTACENAVRRLAKETPLSWTTFRSSVDYFLEVFTDEDAAVLATPGDALRQLLRNLCQPGAWPFLAETSRHQDASWRQDIGVLHQFCVQERIAQLSMPRVPHVPRPFGQERYILHLFAGRRRAGDFQFYLDRISQSHPSLQIYVLSVDIVIDRRFGDLSDSQIQSFWIKAILDQFIVGLLGGPPCETWSRARGKCSPESSVQGSLRSATTGPRPVRSLDAIWGLESLAIREIKQVLIGNLLMGFQLVAMAALACTDGTAVLEHPAEPPEEQTASIWRTPLMQLLLALPGCCRITLAQGLWGAQSAKPTTLAVLNAPELLRDLRAGQVASEVPRHTSIGRSSSGTWKTTHLKEYPPGLCRALAFGFLHSMEQKPLSPECRVSPLFVQEVHHLICTDFGHFIGPDFAG